MSKLDHIGDDALVTELAARLTTRPLLLDWVAAYVNGDALKTDDAAVIAGCSSETVRRRAENAAGTDQPLGVLLAGSVWLISLARLLAWIEHRKGLSARLEAETRAKNLAVLWPPPQLLTRSVATATSEG